MAWYKQVIFVSFGEDRSVLTVLWADMCQICFSASLLVSVLKQLGSHVLFLVFSINCPHQALQCLLMGLIWILLNKGCDRTLWYSSKSVTGRVPESRGIFLLFFWKHQLTYLFCHFQAVSVCRTTTPSAFMRVISPREFVDVVLMKQYDDGTMLSAGELLAFSTCSS